MLADGAVSERPTHPSRCSPCQGVGPGSLAPERPGPLTLIQGGNCSPAFPPKEVFFFTLNYCLCRFNINFNVLYMLKQVLIIELNFSFGASFYRL